MHTRKRLALALTALFVGGAACERREAPVPSIDPSSVRTLDGGSVAGFANATGAHVWLGIPYARPPVGELRWRAPEPAEPWADRLDAISPPSACPQFASPLGIEGGGNGVVGDEDCLYVNVYAPAFDPEEVPGEGERLPVMFWIHGGGNVIGHASYYDGSRLATTERVIVVALNYRLGPFGWLRHAALRGGVETAADRSGNFGTLDLIRALEWVRANIEAFGGDPRNVTIFGESAGGRNVVTLLHSPLASGLFHRAIVQSGSVATMETEKAEGFADGDPAGHVNSSAEVVSRLLRAEDRASREEAKSALEAMSPPEIEGFLRSLDAEAILSAYRREDQEGLIDVPQIFRDGTVLPAGDPLDALRTSRVPTIFGTNRDENKLFLAISPEYVSRFLGTIPSIRDPSRYEATADHLSRLWKARGADAPATRMTAGGNPSVWVYRFDWDEEPDFLWVEVSKLLGAAHAFEIPFVFGHWNLGSATPLLFDDSNAAGRFELSKTMMSYWGTFAHTGDPNGDGDGSRPWWKTFGNPGGRFLVFDTPADGGVRMEEGLVTVDSVIADVDRDPRLPTQRQKCDVYRRFVEWSRVVPRESYPSLGSEGCAEFPLLEPKPE